MGSGREQGVAVLADKDRCVSEQNRTHKLKPIKSQKNGNRGMGVLKLPTHLVDNSSACLAKYRAI